MVAASDIYRGVSQGGSACITNALNSFRPEGPPPDGFSPLRCAKPPFMQALSFKGLRNMQKYKDSYISGDFEGWDGDSIYELEDGSRWELVSYKYSYSYSYRPKATVWRDGGRYYLQVANMSDKQEVREV